MVAFLERWDSTTSTFHLLIGEMIITMEEIHHIYYFPSHGQRIQHIIDRNNIPTTIFYLYGVDRVNMIIFEINLGEIKYL